MPRRPANPPTVRNVTLNNTQGNTHNNTTQAEAQRKLGKFRTFSGDQEENFETFKKQFERKLHTLQVPMEMYCDYLIDNVSGKAADFLFNLPHFERLTPN